MNTTIPHARQRLGMRLWRGMTLQLFLVAVLPLTLLLLAVTFGSLELHHEAMRALVAERNLWAVKSVAATVDQEILHRGAVLEILASRITTAPEAQGIFQGVEDDVSVFEGGVAAVAADGTLLQAAGGSAVRQLTQTPDWAEVQQRFAAAPSGDAQFLPTWSVDNVVYQPVIVKTTSGVLLVGLIHAEHLLADGLAVVAASPTTRVLVTDANHLTLYQNGPFSTSEEELAHTEIQGALEGSGGIDHTQTSEGEHVITSSPIPSVGWALLIEESWEDIASPLLRATQNAPIIFIPVLGFGILALWFGLRQIVQPLQALEGKAGDLARGNFQTIREPVGGVPEIRQLQASLIGMAGQLQEAQNSLHNYIGAITASVESERRNLARELHDETLQAFIALGQYTQYALHWNKDPKVAQALSQVINLADQGMQNLRQLVRGMRPIYIEDLGLIAALSMEAQQRDRQDGALQIHFHQEGDERRLNSEVEMALYRIAQEALSNVQRHANAANAWITLDFQPNALVMEIRDDGQGFTVPPDPVHYARLGHYGLLGLHERVDLIKGKLSVQSAPGSGTVIQVRVPDGAPSDGPQI